MYIKYIYIMYVSYNNNVHRVLCIKIGYLYANNQSCLL